MTQSIIDVHIAGLLYNKSANCFQCAFVKKIFFRCVPKSLMNIRTENPIIAFLINEFNPLNELFFFFFSIVKFIMYKLPCLIYSHADFIMVLTSVPPGTLARVHLDCSIRVYSRMY